MVNDVKKLNRAPKRKTPIDAAEEQFKKTGHYETDSDGKIIKSNALFKPSYRIIHNHSPYSSHRKCV